MWRNNTRFIIIFVLTIGIICSFGYYTMGINAINNARHGCERLNSVREAEFEYLNRDLVQRKELIKQDRDSLEILDSPHPIHAIKEAYGVVLNKATLEQSITQSKTRIKANQGFIKNDKTSIDALVQSAEQYAVRPGSVIVSCASAYPYPWPIDHINNGH